MNKFFEEEYKPFLLNNIRPWAKEASGGTEIQCRCFYCSDSSNPRSQDGSDDVSQFHCKKCGAHGLVTNNKLYEWGLFDTDISVKLYQATNKILNSADRKMSYKFGNSVKYNIRNTTFTDDKLSQFKLKYISDRIGVDLTYQDCINNKIVFNLNDLLRENQITKITRHQSIITHLDTSFMGFLAYDNSRLNMRNVGIGKNIPSSIDKRYVNYNLFGSLDNTTAFYVPPTTIDLTNPEPIKFCMAEGPVDILSIKHNLVKQPHQAIYVAVQGNQYKGALRHFISNMMLINMEIHLYIDNDTAGHHILNDLTSFIYPFNMPVYVHRNASGEKDFGVPLSKIKDSIERII